MNFFIKKKPSGVSCKVFKAVSDHHSRVVPFSSSKLFIKLSRQRRSNPSFEKSFGILKFLLLSSSFSKARRSFVSFQFDYALKNFSSSKHQTTSVLNGRSMSFSKDFKLSRIGLRKLAASGSLPGVFKSSW